MSVKRAVAVCSLDVELDKGGHYHQKIQSEPGHT